MLISDQFVFLHAPKTGGTFVTEVLTEAFGQTNKSLASRDKHSGVEDIPPEHRSKQLVTSVRNPFEFYASHYSFGYWIERELDNLSFWDGPPIRGRYPSYPYLSFGEYLEAALRFGRRRLGPDEQHVADRLRIGPATVSALIYSIADHVAFLEALLETGDTAPLKRALARTRFLHTESLNRDTYQWLLDLGIPPEIAAAALVRAPVKPLNMPDGKILEREHGQPRKKHWTALISEECRQSIFEYEWLFFELFPEYAWTRPAARSSMIAPERAGCPSTLTTLVEGPPADSASYANGFAAIRSRLGDNNSMESPAELMAKLS